jgi:hypothetical protein
MQLPPTQLSPAAHGWLHPPQCWTLACVLTSQPSTALLLLQSANPALHDPLHNPLVHVGVGTWFDEQTPLQPPQFSGSLETGVSQPFVWKLPSQLANPELQLPLQTLLLQIGVELLVLQTMPHPPQLVVDDVVPVSQPSVRLLALQSSNPNAQNPEQFPAVQSG